MSNEIITIEEEKRFEFFKRKAEALISGSILPQVYRNIGDILILEEMSRQLKIPIVMLAQGMYIVSNPIGMTSKYFSSFFFQIRKLFQIP